LKHWGRIARQALSASSGRKVTALTLGLLERSKHDIPAANKNTAGKAWMVDIQVTEKTLSIKRIWIKRNMIPTRSI
jgi:hypothetical protein